MFIAYVVSKMHFCLIFQGRAHSSTGGEGAEQGGGGDPREDVVQGEDEDVLREPDAQG